jgi:hypothetical protein
MLREDGGALNARPGTTEAFERGMLMVLDSETSRGELGAGGRWRLDESLNWESDQRPLPEGCATVLAR